MAAKPVSARKRTRSQRPLWTCPKCGAKLISKHLWHSCGRATLDEWKRKMGPRARVLVEEVVPGWWVHRLRVTEPDQLDESMQAWLRESYRLMGMQERLR